GGVRLHPRLPPARAPHTRRRPPAARGPGCAVPRLARARDLCLRPLRAAGRPARALRARGCRGAPALRALPARGCRSRRRARRGRPDLHQRARGRDRDRALREGMNTMYATSTPTAAPVIEREGGIGPSPATTPPPTAATTGAEAPAPAPMPTLHPGESPLARL